MLVINFYCLEILLYIVCCGCCSAQADKMQQALHFAINSPLASLSESILGAFKSLVKILFPLFWGMLLYDSNEFETNES